MAPRERKRPGVAVLEQAWRADFDRGLAKLQTGDFAAAEQHFARAHERAPERAEVCFALGRELMRRGVHAEAEPLLRRAWELDPSLAIAAAALARCLAVGEPPRIAEAHAVVDQALARHTGDAPLLVLRGELYLDQERADDARAALDLAVTALEERAREGKDLPAARAAAGIALSRAWNLTGVALARGDRTDEALFAFKRSADLDPEASGPIVNMGVAFANLGRSARARSCYERALIIEPDNLTARLNLARLWRDAGDLRRAEAGYRAVLELDPEQEGARAALIELIVARANRGEPAAAEEALAMLRNDLADAPEDAETWFRLGGAYQAADRVAEAERHLRGAIARDPGHVGAHCRLASLLARDGRYLEAATLARRARDLDPDRAAVFLGLADAPE